jgi:transposase
LRELKALIEIEKEAWAKKMFRLLLKALGAVQRAVEKGASVVVDRMLRRILWLYDAIVSSGLAFHQSLPPLALRTRARGRLPRR